MVRPSRAAEVSRIGGAPRGGGRPSSPSARERFPAGVARAGGDLRTAERAFEESLSLRRRLLERGGETPEALRDLSVSLARLGALRTDEALLVEALSIAERLRQSFPDDVRCRELYDYVRGEFPKGPSRGRLSDS